MLDSMDRLSGQNRVMVARGMVNEDFGFIILVVVLIWTNSVL